jgi:hypothetical protein
MTNDPVAVHSVADRLEAASLERRAERDAMLAREREIDERIAEILNARLQPAPVDSI